MVFAFGVDVPLVELLIAFSIVMFIMLVEVTIVMIVLFYQLRYSRELGKQLEIVSTQLYSRSGKSSREIEKLLKEMRRKSGVFSQLFRRKIRIFPDRIIGGL